MVMATGEGRVVYELGREPRVGLNLRRFAPKELDETDLACLRLAADGWSNREIATELHYTEGGVAVRFHRRLYPYFGLNNSNVGERSTKRAALVACALRQGYIT
jgi:DNA-binding NarL/FixJ family response regulator